MQSQFALVYVVRGEGRIVYPDGVQGRLAPGSVFQRRPNEPHTVELSGPSITPFMALPAPVLNIYRAIAPRPAARRVFTVGLDTLIVDRWEHLRVRLRDSAESELTDIELSMQEFVMELMRRGAMVDSEPHAQQLERARALLRAEATTTASLHWIAEKCGLGYSQFRALFRERFGLAPGEFRLRERLRLAQHLLASTHHPIGAIARRLGYRDIYAFSGQFSKKLGMSPRAFRRMSEEAF